MEELITKIAGTASTVVEAMSALVVTYGACEALVRLVRLATVPSAPHGVRKEIWRQFGTWLLIGLEFALAADIIATAISPTWDDIGRLGAIAVIRTFLNYFLEKDLRRTEPESAFGKTC